MRPVFSDHPFDFRVDAHNHTRRVWRLCRVVLVCQRICCYLQSSETVDAWRVSYLSMSVITQPTIVDRIAQGYMDNTARGLGPSVLLLRYVRSMYSVKLVRSIAEDGVARFPLRSARRSNAFLTPPPGFLLRCACDLQCWRGMHTPQNAGQTNSRACAT